MDMLSLKNRVHWVQALAALLGFGVVCGFPSAHLTGDFKVYLSTAMEMWDRGEWLHPILYQHSSYFKPPFQYWATLLGWKIFGFGNFGAYFPSVVALALTTLLIGQISLFFSRQNRVVPQACAGLWFAGNIASMCYGTVTQMEVWVALFATLGAWLMLRSFYDSDGTVRPISNLDWKSLTFYFIAAGVSSWVKSPIYSIFSISSLWLFLGLLGRYDLFKNVRFYFLHALGAAVGLAWYFAIWLTDREAFLSRYVGQESVGKLSGNGVSVIQLLLDFSVWCSPLLLLLWMLIGIPFFHRNSQFKSWYDGLKNPRNAWVLANLLPPILFFFSFPYRLEAYLYITLPFLALLMEWELPQLPGSAWVAGGSGLLFGLAAFFVGVVFTFSHLVHFWVGALICCIALVMSGVGIRFIFEQWIRKGEKIKKGRLWVHFAWSSLLLVVAVRWAAASLGTIDLAFFRNWMEQHPTAQLGLYDPTHDIWHERATLGVAVGKVAYSIDSVQSAVDFLKAGGVIVFNEDYLNHEVLEVEHLFHQQRVEGQFGFLESQTWYRPKRAFYLPTPEALIKMTSRTDPEWMRQFMKKYRVLFIEKSGVRPS